VHRQGGISGYAHANNQLFNVNSGMTLDVPLGIVDFAEFCEAGNVKPSLYYEFLNLGYALTAAGGSDVPYYGSMGDSRTYAYIPGRFSADAWLDSFANGHTFVSAGPMLTFSVEGRLPGDRITVKRGERVRIQAAMESEKSMRDPGQLEIVVNGDVVRSAPSTLDFELPVTQSIWVAARCSGAHTTPVYITVDGQRHWNRAAAPELIATRLGKLDEIEQLLEGGIRRGERIQWEAEAAFQRDGERLRAQISQARAAYRKLQSELSGSPR
jgi:hypothetical protein